MSTQELRPCPFCGGRRLSIEEQMGRVVMPTADYRIVLCADCFSRTGLHHTEEEAIAAWNTRPRPDAEVREGLGQTIDAIERRMEQCSTMENGRFARRMLAEVRDFAMSRLSLLSPKQENDK